MKDKNGIELKDGDVIDIHQTVNGHNLFIVLTVEPLVIVYAYDPFCKYEYNKEELLAPIYDGSVEWEIVNNVEGVK